MSEQGIERAKRLKFNRRGWFAHAFTMATGKRDFYTGAIMPDRYGCFWQEIWIGPYRSARAAIEAMWA
jgi:hypothetical protein